MDKSSASTERYGKLVEDRTHPEPPAQGSSIPATLVRRLDGLPDLLALHAAFPQRYPALLESVSRGTAQARFDILFATSGPRLTLNAAGALEGDVTSPAGNDFLQHFDRWWRAERAAPAERGGLPFAGGWFLYLGYELAHQIEPRLGPLSAAVRAGGAASALPVALALRCPAALIRDHARQQAWLVAEAEHGEWIERMAADLEAVAGREMPRPERQPVLAAALEEEDPERFLAGVAAIQRHIAGGDVFQVNLSRAWTGVLTRRGAEAAVLYRRLCAANPAPFAGLAVIDGSAVISSSPERLVRVQDGTVETRPIAGTRPRGGDRDADAALSRRLLSHPKERAEHIMLIDLERNDLGRVCVPGTVRVSELMALESYAHVHHIVSNVKGTLRAETTPGEVIRAVFPGGTITGCPKVRCMEIISALEAAPRGPYTGAMGYVNRDGGMDLNILIRTLVCAGGGVNLRAGAGIVADSQAHKELEETRAKARGLIKALEG